MVSSKEYARQQRGLGEANSSPSPYGNPLTQQKLLDDFISSHKSQFSYSHLIAGGAPRNWIVGKVANDIDIFFLDYREDSLIQSLQSGNFTKMKGSKEKKKNKLKKLKRKSAFLDGLAPAAETAENYIGVGVDGEFRLIKSIWNKTWDDIEVQFIILNYENCVNAGIESLQEFVEKTFDFNICKIWYEANSKSIIPSESAMQDFESKTLTVSIGDMIKYQRLTTLAKRSAKLQSYFPNHKINIVP